MIKLRHERMLILRCILPPQQLNYLQKKSYPPPGHHLKNLKHPDKKLKALGYLNPLRNLKLLKKYQPPPPPPSKKENLNLQKNEKKSLLVKVSSTLKLPQPL